jgi:hypothetical protein
VHPSRPAVDRCPVCDRPRCGADAGPDCAACRGTATAGTTTRPPTDLERLVRAALAAFAVALLGGLVASEYVGATVFSYVGPFVVGVVCGGAATKAAGSDGRGPLGTRVRVIGAVLGVLGVGFGFLEEQSMRPLSADVHVLLPYVAAVAGAVLWTVPPRPRRDSADQGASTAV